MAAPQAGARLQGAPDSCPTSPTCTNATAARGVDRRHAEVAAPRGGMPELSEDDPFYEFFRRFGQVPPRRGPEREPEAQAVGFAVHQSAATAR
jgi:hypothetical protein